MIVTRIEERIEVGGNGRVGRLLIRYSGKRCREGRRVRAGNEWRGRRRRRTMAAALKYSAPSRKQFALC